ncbi:MAG: CbtB-domain containing protein [Actinomycetota bacterium]|nr:CbtB-domain containing protein [Actinomycetota bacterium]
MQLDDVLELERVAVPPWAWLVLVLAALAVYLVTLDNGVVLKGVATTAHELFHDTRHFIGVPCH